MQKIYSRVLLFLMLTLISFCVKGVTASFTIDHSTGCAPLVVSFTNTSVGATSYSWDLGNGTITGLPNPSTSYASPGTYFVTLKAYSGGDSSVIVHSITVNPRPIATISGGPASICPGTAINFTSMVTPGASGPVSYEWYFGDGATDVVANPSHTYNLPYGTKNVTLTVTNSLGCDTTITMPSYINVYTPPVINFTAANTIFCTAPATVNFTNSTVGYGSLTYNWSFGDGTTSTDVMPSHTYLSSGSYTVRLICTDGHGCSDTLIRNNYVHIGTLNADFNVPASACNGDVLNFVNTSTDYTFSTWTFGDGSNSFTDNPSHGYLSGTYNVTLIVTNGVCYDTLTRTIIVHSPLTPGTINAVSSCPAPVTVTYSTSGYSTGASVKWRFGDYYAYDTISGVTVNHTYLSNGWFDVVVTYTDPYGCTNYTVRRDSVFDATFKNNIPPYLCLGTNYMYYDSLLSYVFGHRPYRYPVTSTLWNFGDGTTSTLATPNHVYAAVGTYMVTCRVTTANGCTFTDTGYTTVTNDPPVVTITATEDTVCYGVPVTFYAHLVHGPVSGYRWFFEDNPPLFLPVGTTDTTITHVFNYPGVFTVTVNADLGGCSGASSIRIVVDSPKAIVGVRYNCGNRRAALFIDSSMGDTWHQWLFPDGTTSLADTVTHIFPSLGWDSVRLVTFNSRSGCRDTAIRRIQLYDVKPRLTLSDSTYCQSQAFSSNNEKAIITVDTGHRIIADTIYIDWTYHAFVLESWGNYVQEIYPDTGFHHVEAISIDERGCRDTTVRSIWVSNPIARFATHPFCAGAPDPFLDSSSFQSFAPIKHYWSYGDGTHDTLTSPTAYHYYTTGGTFLVSETIKDSFGCTSTVTQPTHVWHPEGTVEMLPYPCKNIATHFHLNTHDTITSSSWTFGDGATSSADTPVHTYIDTGYFHLQLVITDNHGCTDTLRDTIHISIPHAAFLTDTFLVCNPFRDSFINMSSGATTYLWNFGDGNSSAYTSPPNTYVSPGVYAVQLIAFTEHGCADTEYSRVHVFGFSGDFAYPDSGCGPLSVHFSAGLIHVDSIRWDFGDATTSTALLTDSTTHIYTSVGAHTPRLIIYKGGCSGYSDGDQPVRVDTVFPGFGFSPIICPGQPTIFIDTSRSYYSMITGWHWSADGTFWSTDNPAFYAFSSPGMHAITTTATDGWGCSSSITDSVSVRESPVLPPILGDSIICLGSTPIFTDSLPGGYWETWDDAIAIVDSSGHVTIVDTGAGGVSYIFTDTFGCSTGADIEFYVAPIPILDGIVGDTVCAHDSVLIATSLSGGAWTFNDPSIAMVGASGYIVGLTAGTTGITYTVTNSYGCSTEVHNFFTVMAVPGTPVVTGPDSMCVNTGETFTTSIQGGVWESSNTSVAIVDSTGYVFILDTGTVAINYILSNWHCSTVVTHPVHIITTPFIPPVTGANVACIGSVITLSDPMPGGFWVSIDPSVATIDSFGGVTGVGAGTTLIVYVVSNTCGYNYALDTITIVTPSPPITGIPAVCSGSVTILHNPVPGGEWSSSNTDVAEVNPVTGEVTGIGYGTATISYTVTTPCPFVVTMDVRVDMAPIITTNFLVACQSMSDGGGISSKGVAMGEPSESGGPAIDDGGGCLLVCEHTTVRYYGHGVADSRFTWTCLGGTIVATYGDNADSIDVFWPTTGVVGSIMVTDTFSHCIGEAELCVKVISKPHAEFTTNTVGACLGDGIAFYDASVADTLSPIAGWYWDFGDGTSFGDQYPPPHVYGGPGVYIVTLVVWNACHCADSFHIKVYVEENPGPQIHCPAIVCEDEIATYSIDDPCDPEWVVTGGHIIDGDGTETIIVKWDDAPADGHGYVQVTNTCGDCNLPSIVTVPIILADAPISGPSFACVGQQYTYSIPLWAGTDYEWGVLGYPGIIIGYNNDHKMTVTFPGPGTYTIHAWYQNRLKLCGGNVTKTVVVKDVSTISGVTHLCVSDATDQWYSLSGGHEGIWTVVDPTGVTTTTSTPYNGTYVLPNIPGIWLINAAGDFCVNPINVIVEGIPHAIDSVVGEDTVCLNRVYTYKAYNDVPGTTYEWSIIGGNVIPASGSETVDVVWTSTGTKQLMVRHEPDAEPHCDAPVMTINVIQEYVNPQIAGDSTPCSNGLRQYSAGYLRAENYNWKIFPDSVGSVVSGDHSPQVSVLWNNVVAFTDAYVVVAAQKCDTIVADTFHIRLQPPPVVSISASDTLLCPGEDVVFTPHNGSGTYRWDFGDGTTLTSGSTSVHHLYDDNTTSGNISYTVRLTSLLDTNSYCPSTGVAFFTIVEQPGPIANATTGFGPYWCLGDTPILVGTVTENVTGLTYQWYKNGTAVSSANGTEYTAIGDGADADFYFMATAANGCWDTSELVHFDNFCSHGGGGSDTLDHGGPGGCTFYATASSTHNCNVITLSGTPPGTWCYWKAEKTPSGGTFTGNVCSTAIATAIYDKPGIYRFSYHLNAPGLCNDTILVIDTVGIVPDFYDYVHCNPDGTDSLFLIDHSVRLSWFTISPPLSWSESSVFAYGSTATAVFPTNTSHTITLNVSGAEPNGPFSCSVSKMINIPARIPHFGYTFSPGSICEEIPVAFTPASTAGVAGFLWQFGNGGTNRLTSPKCAYDWNPLGGNPNSNFSVMTVTDTSGCRFDTSIGLINIYRNVMSGSMDPGDIVCPNNAPYSLGYTNFIGGPIISYAWSNGDSTFVPYTDVYNSGAYSVRVYDAHQCRYMPLTVENVKVLRVPTAQIRGKLNYCTNDQINLNGYAGHSVSYQWFVNGSVFPIDHVSFYLPAGDYPVTLVLSMYDTADAVGPCTDTATAILHVYQTPDAPVITGPTIVDCDLYHLQLSATASEPGVFNWSNSDYGPVANVYTGGPIGVVFTNMAGCSNSAQTLVPSAPGYYFQYLPSGCYDICKERFPIRLYGPPHVPFDSWEWRKDGIVVSSGSGIMDPYSVSVTGEYQWVLANGLCNQKSPLLDVTAIGCGDCNKINVDVKRIECAPGDPVVYTAYINVIDPYVGDTYTVGTDGGPLTPFSGTISSTSTLLTLSLAVIDTDATTVTIYIELTHHNGTKCMYKKVVSLPDCSWIAEKPIADTQKAAPLTVSTAMLVYPNPATQMVTISYDYGDQPFKERSISVFDQLGRRTQSLQVQDSHNTWQLNTTDWTPGVYIIRMEGDGKVFQTQRLIVNN